MLFGHSVILQAKILATFVLTWHIQPCLKLSEFKKMSISHQFSSSNNLL